MRVLSTAGTKGVPREIREAQFLDIAAEQIARTGYAGLSLREVATQAGVSKPLVYAYFDTKDRLYIACVERAAALLSEAIESAAHGSGSDRAKETFRRVLTALEPRPSDWSVLFDRSHPLEGPVAEASRNARRRIAAQSRESVAAALANTGIQPDPTELSTLADLWMGSFSALVNWWIRHPEVSAELMVQRSHRLIDTLIRAAAGPKGPRAFGDKCPQIDDTAWVAPNATVIGDVVLHAGAGIWYQAVLRAEVEPITIGERSNIQDGCVIHTDRGFPVRVGTGVSVGHNAILHGCTIGDDVLVGMGATILNGATIGAGSLIAANALVPQGAEIPAGSLVAGVPGKIRRPVSDAEADSIRANAASYEELREGHRSSGATRPAR